jgi:hypothetical protein
MIHVGNVNQEASGMPDGEREHVHLSPGFQLSGIQEEQNYAA